MCLYDLSLRLSVVYALACMFISFVPPPLRSLCNGFYDYKICTSAFAMFMHWFACLYGLYLRLCVVYALVCMFICFVPSPSRSLCIGLYVYNICTSAFGKFMHWLVCLYALYLRLCVVYTLASIFTSFAPKHLRSLCIGLYVYKTCNSAFA